MVTMQRMHCSNKGVVRTQPKTFSRDGKEKLRGLEKPKLKVWFARYYSDAVLGSLHRKMAIDEWVKLKDGESIALERALVAYDMFVLHEREGDFDEVSELRACL